MKRATIQECKLTRDFQSPRVFARSAIVADGIHRLFYGSFLNSKAEGRGNIRCTPNFLIAPNHTSLSIWACQNGLGEAGRDMVAWLP